ncbi:ECF transporter S component [Methanogenium cariaci]|jgi:ABC-type thiamin/hydroxymethylpyrimidine transport system permease subunit
MHLEKYFSLNEIALMSICGAMIFVMKIAFKIPVHIPGHSGIFWVIPMIIGISIVRKPGAGIYIGLISGLLASFFGIGALHVFDIFKYLAVGIAADICSMLFVYRFDLIAVGVITGAVANVVKMVVSYSVELLLGVQPFFIIIGIGVSSFSHILFGGLGGLISVYIIRRLTRAGVIGEKDG